MSLLTKSANSYRNRHRKGDISTSLNVKLSWERAWSCRDSAIKGWDISNPHLVVGKQLVKKLSVVCKNSDPCPQIRNFRRTGRKMSKYCYMWLPSFSTLVIWAHLIAHREEPGRFTALFGELISFYL